VAQFLEAERRRDEDDEPLDLRGHTRDAARDYLARHPRITSVVQQLIGGRPRIVQTMFMAKHPGGATGVALHQDTHYIKNEPNTLMACWIAFSDTGPDNGGLCVLPGSNNAGLLSAGRVRDTEQHTAWDNIYDMSDPDGREWQQPMHSFDIAEIEEKELARLTVPPGAGVFFTGMTAHGSYANESRDRERLAFATHYVREETWVYRKDIQETVPV
jgi:ectoine hydroxylase-related dioxygenase (phytanoyl-CoA dioxygenase family)